MRVDCYLLEKTGQVLCSKGRLATPRPSLNDCERVVEDVAKGLALHCVERTLGGSNNRVVNAADCERSSRLTEILVEPPQMAKDAFLEHVIAGELQIIDWGHLVLEDVCPVDVLRVLVQWKQVTLPQEPVQAGIANV